MTTAYRQELLRSRMETNEVLTYCHDAAGEPFATIRHAMADLVTSILVDGECDEGDIEIIEERIIQAKQIMRIEKQKFHDKLNEICNKAND